MGGVKLQAHTEGVSLLNQGEDPYLAQICSVVGTHEKQFCPCISGFGAKVQIPLFSVSTLALTFPSLVNVGNFLP